MIDKIATLLKKGCNIVVHCHAGIGRTGLTICCLAKKYLLVSNDNLIPWIRNSVRGAVQVTYIIYFILTYLDS
jgi:protein-tyrosine phosphatase